MKSRKLNKFPVHHAVGMLAATLFAVAAAAADGPERSVFVLTSTNNPSGNEVAVFKLDAARTPSLSLVDMLPTQGKGGAGGNAGILQFKDDLGAVGNYGSNTVSRIARHQDFINIDGTIGLAPNCVKPDSVALAGDHLFVVGTNCVESHAWPSGRMDGTVVALTDPSAAQVAVGKNWAAVTMTSGTLLQLPLSARMGCSVGQAPPCRSRARPIIPRSGPRSGTMSWDLRRPTAPTASLS